MLFFCKTVKVTLLLYNRMVLLAVGTSIRLLLTIVLDETISRIMFSFLPLNQRHTNYHRHSFCFQAAAYTPLYYYYNKY